MRIRDWSSDVCSADLTRRADASGRGRPHRQCGDLDHAVARLNCAFLMLTRQFAHRLIQPIERQRIHPLVHQFADEPIRFRSEEHTSELQSLMRISYAVFCLKKKKYLLEQTKYFRKLYSSRS